MRSHAVDHAADARKHVGRAFGFAKRMHGRDARHGRMGQADLEARAVADFGNRAAAAHPGHIEAEGIGRHLGLVLGKHVERHVARRFKTRLIDNDIAAARDLDVRIGSCTGYKRQHGLISLHGALPADFHADRSAGLRRHVRADHFGHEIAMLLERCDRSCKHARSGIAGAHFNIDFCVIAGIFLGRHGNRFA